jgi:ssDNA-binding Zn-finger/Zn-ribbon topoisomerase 1
MKRKVRFVENLETKIQCPECETAAFLVMRSNRTNDGQFLGCPNCPECRYTRGIPQEWYMSAPNQPTLLDLPEAQNGD